MYLVDFEIADIKCFRDARLSFPTTGGSHAGFNVLIGENGTGKSTLLQAMALLMLGPDRHPWVEDASWPRIGKTHGRLAGQLKRGEADVNRGKPRDKPYKSRLWVTGREAIDKQGHLTDPEVKVPVSSEPALIMDPNHPGLATSVRAGPYSGLSGWFSAGYGPFRRLTGNDPETAKLVDSDKASGRFATLFEERAALTRCEDWLTTLYSSSIDSKLNTEERTTAESDLVAARDVIDALLPPPVRLHEITSRQVRFKTVGGAEVSLSSLSDGYRSFLALVVDLLRLIQLSSEGLASQVERVDDEDGIRAHVSTEGVVLIDEADAHLHPTWQRRLGFELTRVFPHMQFIATTHSPFLAMAAQDGGLFRLVPDADGQVVIDQSVRSVRGERADQVLLGPLFDLDSTRDPETEALLDERRELKLSGRQLTAAEKQRLEQIEEELRGRLTGPGDTLREQDEFRLAGEMIRARLAELHREQGR